MATNNTTGAKLRTACENLLACFVVLVTAASCRPLFVRQVSSQILRVEGKVFAESGAAKFPLTNLQWLQPGAKIITSAESRVDIALLPGILVELAPNTEIALQPSRFARDGDEHIHAMEAREARLRLVRGALIASIGQAQTRSRLSVETAAGTLASDSARTFAMETRDNKLRIICARGPAQFQPNDKSPGFRIKAGYVAGWPPDSLRNPRPVADSDPTLQAELAKILAVEKKLILLEKEVLAQDAKILRAKTAPPGG